MQITNNILNQQIIPLTIICIIIGICIFPLAQSNRISKEGLGINNMTIIKGVACIMVVITHVCSQLKGEGILALPANIGFLAVGIFFFCSGYGLIYSYINKENYTNNFLKKRMSSILIPFWSANIIYVIIKQKSSSILCLIENILGIKLICGHFWYIQSIIVFYVLFYMCAKIFKDKRKMIVILIILSVIYDIWWQINNKIIGQSLPFVLGIIFAFADLELLEKKLNDAKQYLLIVFCAGGIFSFTFFTWSILKWHIDFPVYFISTIGIVCQNIFVILVVLLAMKFISNSIIGKYIGKVSYEIFLLHQIAIDIFKNLSQNITVVIICSIGLVILLGSASHWIMEKLIKRVNR